MEIDGDCDASAFVTAEDSMTEAEIKDLQQGLAADAVAAMTPDEKAAVKDVIISGLEKNYPGWAMDKGSDLDLDKVDPVVVSATLVKLKGAMNQAEAIDDALASDYAMVEDSSKHDCPNNPWCMMSAEDSWGIHRKHLAIYKKLGEELRDEVSEEECVLCEHHEDPPAMPPPELKPTAKKHAAKKAPDPPPSPRGYAGGAAPKRAAPSTKTVSNKEAKKISQVAYKAFKGAKKDIFSPKADLIKEDLIRTTATMYLTSLVACMTFG